MPVRRLNIASTSGSLGWVPSVHDFRIASRFGAGSKGITVELTSLLEGRGSTPEDFFGRPTRDDRREHPEIPVELNQGCSAGLVGIQSQRNRLGPIVLALVKRAAAEIAHALSARWLCRQMENRLALLAGAASAQARNNFGKGQLIIYYRIER